MIFYRAGYAIQNGCQVWFDSAWSVKTQVVVRYVKVRAELICAWLMWRAWHHTTGQSGERSLYRSLGTGPQLLERGTQYWGGMLTKITSWISILTSSHHWCTLPLFGLMLIYLHCITLISPVDSIVDPQVMNLYLMLYCILYSPVRLSLPFGPWEF